MVQSFFEHASLTRGPKREIRWSLQFLKKATRGTHYKWLNLAALISWRQEALPIDPLQVVPLHSRPNLAGHKRIANRPD
jgi:hypothetical protein